MCTLSLCRYPAQDKHLFAWKFELILRLIEHMDGIKFKTLILMIHERGLRSSRIRPVLYLNSIIKFKYSTAKYIKIVI